MRCLVLYVFSFLVHLIYSDTTTVVCGRKSEIVSFSDNDDDNPGHKYENTVLSLVHCVMVCNNLNCGSFSYLPDIGICRTFGQRLCDTESNVNRSIKFGNYVITASSGKKNCNKPKHCKEISACSTQTSGIYTIHPDGIDGELDVFCDMETDSGGWMVFQRRMDGTEDFYRSWKDYKEGFGNLCGEFWIGNNILHNITSQTSHEMRVDMEDFEGNVRYATYSTFSVGDENSNYALTATGYTGNAGNALHQHNNKPFSTRDVDNDLSGSSCAMSYHGGWWYEKCHMANLNGLYLCGSTTRIAEGIVWKHWTTYSYSLKYVTMKVRPV